VSLRGTGRTTRMLLEVIEMLPNACLMPILVCGYCSRHAKGLARTFIRLASDRGMKISMKAVDTVMVNGDEIVEFRALHDDSPPGVDYSHIFVDHYASSREDFSGLHNGGL